MEKSLCVLIPSYNEARTIGGIVRDLRIKGLAVYVVDDGSTDDTASIASGAGAMVVKHPKNMGKGSALREGFRRAMADGFGAVIAMDGDGQHLVSDIGNFIEMHGSGGADVIIGSRMNDLSSMPAVRVHTNRFMSWLISLVAGQRVEDSQSGYRLITRPVIEKIVLESSNYEIESEMIIKSARAGFRIGSVPIKTVYSTEKSKVNPVIDTLRFIRFMFKMLFNSRSYDSN